MAAIPVPVHFDGHNINIITEDSPSTCKNRTKNMTFNKKNNKRPYNNNGKYGSNKHQITRGGNKEIQTLNKTNPMKNKSDNGNKENIDENTEKGNNNIHNKIHNNIPSLPLAPKKLIINNNNNKIISDNTNTPQSLNKNTTLNTIINGNNDDSKLPLKQEQEGPISILQQQEININKNKINISSTHKIENIPIIPPSTTTINMNAILSKQQNVTLNTNISETKIENESNNNINNKSLGHGLNAHILNNLNNLKINNNKRLNVNINGPSLPIPPRKINNINNINMNMNMVNFNTLQTGGHNININNINNNINNVTTMRPINNLSALNKVNKNNNRLSLTAHNHNHNQHQSQTQSHSQLHPHPQNQNQQQHQQHQHKQQQQMSKEVLLGPNGELLNPEEFGSHDDDGDQLDSSKDRQNLYKTELCREWSTSGWCYYNKRCSFAHGLQELRPVFRSKKWRTKRCRNWHTTGYCPYEHRCQFLHDQSPPRRISDYATANARALVAAQQRMQPLYFHYQVDCNRDEDDESDDDESDNNNNNNNNNKRGGTGTNKSRSGTPRSRLNKIGNNNYHKNKKGLGSRKGRNSYPTQQSSKKNNSKPSTPRGSAPNIKPSSNNNHNNHNGQFRNRAFKMIMNRKNGNNFNQNQNQHQSQQRGQSIQKPNNIQNVNGYINKGQDNSERRGKTKKSKKKRQHNEPVITPFNPVVNYGPSNQSFVLAAEQLGLYNTPNTTVPEYNHSIEALQASVNKNNVLLNHLQRQSVALQNNITAGNITAPNINTSVNTGGLGGLPPTIDPALFLSFTPSPPGSPPTTGLSGPILPVQVPLLTTHTPTLPTIPSHTEAHHTLTHTHTQPPNHTHGIPQQHVHQHGHQQPSHQHPQTQQSLGGINKIPVVPSINGVNNVGVEGLNVECPPSLTPSPTTMAVNTNKVNQQLQMQLLAQQQQVQLLQQKLQATQAQNIIINRSNTPVAPLDGNILEALLPDDNTINKKKDNNNKNDEDETKISEQASITNNDNNNNHDKTQKLNDNGNRSDKQKDIKKVNGNDKGGKNDIKLVSLPTLPPIPPPLTLQTSINSVVNGAVAAAIATPTPTNKHLIPITPNIVDGNTGQFTYPQPLTHQQNRQQPTATTVSVPISKTSTTPYTTRTTDVHMYNPTPYYTTTATTLPQTGLPHTQHTTVHSTTQQPVPLHHQVQPVQPSAHAYAHAYATSQHTTTIPSTTTGLPPHQIQSHATTTPYYIPPQSQYPLISQPHQIPSTVPQPVHPYTVPSIPAHFAPSPDYVQQSIPVDMPYYHYQQQHPPRHHY